MAGAHVRLWAGFNSKEVFEISGSERSVKATFPGFESSSATPRDFGPWADTRDSRVGTYDVIIGPIAGSALPADMQFKFEHRAFAVVFKRPLVLRFLTILVGCTALISIVAVTLATPLKELFKTLAASLVSLWGLTKLLGTNAPHGPTLIDYVAVSLLCIQFGIIMVRLLMPRYRLFD